MKTQVKILETKHWFVVLADDQTLLGRCVVVDQSRKPSLSKVTEAQWVDFSQVVKIMEGAAKIAFGAIMCNWTCLMNLAYKKTPPDPHVHWHFRPRYNTPVDFAGLTFNDEAFGGHYQQGTDRKVDDKVKALIEEEYKRAIQNNR